MPLSEMGKMRKDQCVLKVGARGAVQEIGLHMLSVRYPKTSRGTVQEIVGYDPGSQQRSAPEAGIGELSSHGLFMSFSIFFNANLADYLK